MGEQSLKLTNDISEAQARLTANEEEKSKLLMNN